MTLQEYQKQAKRTLGNATMDNLIMGVIGETGEVIDYVKKVTYHGHQLKREKLIEELGDLLWYVSSVATIKGFALGSYDENEPEVAKLIDGSKKTIGKVSFDLYHGTKHLIVDHSLSDTQVGLFLILENIQHLAHFVGATLADIMDYNIAKLYKRYPNGFERQKSINRR